MASPVLKAEVGSALPGRNGSTVGGYTPPSVHGEEYAFGANPFTEEPRLTEAELTVLWVPGALSADNECHHCGRVRASVGASVLKKGRRRVPGN